MLVCIVTFLKGSYQMQRIIHIHTHRKTSKSDIAICSQCLFLTGWMREFIFSLSFYDISVMTIYCLIIKNFF